MLMKSRISGNVAGEIRKGFCVFVSEEVIFLDHILLKISGVPRKFVGGGVQQIWLRTESRENRDLGAVAP
jgi:hypothetical protein